MSFEMSCANCEGRLMVEELGIVVACPHCGTHLAIPAEIPGLNVPPQSESGSPEADEAEDDNEDDPRNNKSTWFPGGMPEEDLPDSFPDFSNLSSSGSPEKSASESNVLVSEPHTDSESEVPSAVRVANPDPSAIMPAIITDSTLSKPVSGFPVIKEPSAAEPRTASEESVLEEDAEEENDAAAGALAESEEAPTIAGPIAAESPDPPSGFPGIKVEGDADEAAGLPLINTGAAQESGEVPMIDTGESEQEDDIPAMTNAAGAVAPAIATTPKPAGSAPAVEKQSHTAAPEKPREEGQKETVYDSVYSSRRGKFVPHTVFQVWFSYTIFATFFLVWAIYRLATATASNLESLPDVKPLKENVRNYVPEKAVMPPGHTLELGETQRFGHIEVTPIKVTRGNLEIEGLDPEGPVLKLYLKFRNVSKDQTIVPLDEEILFDRNRSSDRKAGAIANQFVCKTSEKHEKGEIVLVYGRLYGLDFEFKNQGLDTPLKPGEEVIVYIPTETEALGKLEGDLVWRVHFRKGYSPKNYGVTTVFEVEFNSDAIQPESANA